MAAGVCFAENDIQAMIVELHGILLCWFEQVTTLHQSGCIGDSYFVGCVPRTRIIGAWDAPYLANLLAMGYRPQVVLGRSP